MENKKTTFELLADTNVNSHIDKKKTGGTELSYLSWAWAWDYFKRAIPDAKYEIRHWGDCPYLFDEKTGYMVETGITAGGETHVMWLPVMDGTNHAMLDHAYTVKTKYNQITVPAATMFDINKTIMRCLVKNMAMFGLGLYIYAGEDLPVDTEPTDAETQVNDKLPDFLDAPKNMSVDDFIAAAEKCASVGSLQTLLNSQRSNPNIKRLAEIATARKQALQGGQDVNL